MTCGGTPFFSMIRESSGNMRPSAKPKTVIAEMAAKRFIKRCLSMRHALHQPAAREDEAGKQNDVDEGDGQRNGVDAEGVGRRSGDRRAQYAANAPHGGEGRTSGDEIRSLEMIAENS